MLDRRFTCVRLSQPYLTWSIHAFDHNVHHRGHCAAAACGSLKPLPAERLRGDLPSFLVQHEACTSSWHNRGAYPHQLSGYALLSLSAFRARGARLPVNREQSRSLPVSRLVSTDPLGAIWLASSKMSQRSCGSFRSATGNAQSLGEQFPLPCWRNLFDPFFQGYGHCVTHRLPDRLANICPYGQFMCAITQSHERTPKGVPIDFATDLHQSAGPKELD